MDRIKFLEESIAQYRSKINKIIEDCDNETRARNEDEQKAWKEAKASIEKLSDELRDLKEAEEARKDAAKKADEEKRKLEESKTAGKAVVGETSFSERSEILNLSAKFSIARAAKAVYDQRQIDGVEAELTQEAKRENREGGNTYTTSGNVSIPAKVLQAEWEARATVDQTNSAIQPTFIGRYVEGIRQNAVFSQVIPAANILTGLTGDVKIPAVGANTVAWATAENSAAADGGAQFTKDTLAPVRATGYYDISNRLLLQNGDVALNMIADDVARATAELIDDALFSTSNITNGIPSIAATSGVNTFTEAATYAAPSSTVNGTVFDDYLEALQTLANVNSAKGALAFVGHSKLMSDLVKSPQVLAVSPAARTMMPGAPMQLDLNGVRFMLTTSNTSNGTTSADFIGGDFNFVYLGFFGGLDISMDPYSAKLNDEMRIVLHRHLDASTIRGAAFVKATSLLS